MKFDITRWGVDYKIVNVKADNNNIDLGFNTVPEARYLAEELLQAVNSLVADTFDSEEEYLYFITSNC